MRLGDSDRAIHGPQKSSPRSPRARRPYRPGWRLGSATWDRAPHLYHSRSQALADLQPFNNTLIRSAAFNSTLMCGMVASWIIGGRRADVERFSFLVASRLRQRASGC